jgi:hypothetical protein
VNQSLGREKCRMSSKTEGAKVTGSLAGERVDRTHAMGLEPSCSRHALSNAQTVTFVFLSHSGTDAEAARELKRQPLASQPSLAVTAAGAER